MPSVLSRLLPGVGRVQAQAAPFAAAWREANLQALASRRHRDGLAQRFTDLLTAVPPGTVVATLPNPAPAGRAVNDRIVRHGAEHGLVAETRDPRTASWRGKLAEDHFHPNELGYASIAAVFTAPSPGDQHSRGDQSGRVRH